MATTSSGMVERRTFLAGLLGAAGTAAVSAFATLPGLGVVRAATRKLVDLDRATFAPYLGDRFTVGLPEGGSTRLVLVEAVEAPAHWRPDPASVPALAARQPFSILFRGQGATRLPQATYAIRHRDLGVLSLFIVPIGSSLGGAETYYQAVFG